MMTLRILSILLIAFMNFSLIYGQLGDQWYDTVHQLGSQNALLNCTSQPHINYTFQYWILPNNKIISSSKIFFLFLFHVKVCFCLCTDSFGYILEDKNLTIVNVNKTDLGVYYCVLKAENDIQLIKRGINIKGSFLKFVITIILFMCT